MGFSVFVEMLNLRLQKAARSPVHFKERLDTPPSDATGRTT
jgi:hypothetical protein